MIKSRKQVIYEYWSELIIGKKCHKQIMITALYFSLKSSTPRAYGFKLMSAKLDERITGDHLGFK